MIPERGDVLCCERSLGTLVKGSTYHFLYSPSWSDCTYLIEYVHGSDPHSTSRRRGKKNATKKALEPSAALHVIKKDIFEHGLMDGFIAVVTKNPGVPPWMLPHNQDTLRELSARRRDPKIQHDERIARRVRTVEPAASQIQQILCSPAPIQLINRLAIEQTPVQNTARFRCWLFTYLLYGPIGLHYSASRIGKWNRRAAATHAPPRKSLVTEERHQKIIAAYRRFFKSTRSRRQLYGTAMVHAFGCAVQTGSNGYRALYHPRGEWFPNKRVFFYQVALDVPTQAREAARFGKKRYRTEKAPLLGSFTELVANAYERVEYDPFYNVAHPSSLTGQVMPKFSVGRLRDAASGTIIGVSFDLASETYEQYRAALFCAAIDKQTFCELFGIQIEHDDWPTKGLPLKVFMDRGPHAIALDRRKGPPEPIPELAPAGSGQSKANVETSHPKNLTDKEGPHHHTTPLTVWQMCRQEIRRVMKDNESFDVSERIPAAWLGSIQRATPLALMNEYSKRGRSDCIQISFDTAVRSFLPRVPVHATKDGIFLGGRLYVSRDLQATGFFRRIPGSRQLQTSAYHLRGCVSAIWLEHKGKLFELSFVPKVNDGVEEACLDIFGLDQTVARRKELRRQLDPHRDAVQADMDQRSISDTGHPIDYATRKPGRIKRTRSGISEGRHNIDAMRGKV